MKIRAIALAALAIMILGVAGCSEPGDRYSSGGAMEVNQVYGDGSKAGPITTNYAPVVEEK